MLEKTILTELAGLAKRLGNGKKEKNIYPNLQMPQMRF